MQFEEAGNYILYKLAKNLPGHLYYHNAVHTNDVFDACKRLAEPEDLDPHEIKLLLTAAYYHDAGFLGRYEGHETISCDIARETLPQYGYDKPETDQICNIIMATRIPQSPKNRLGEILADADLDYLGRDDFFVLSNKLYLELLSLGKVAPDENWDQVQVDFLENHCYFTETARSLRQLKKEKHLKQLKAKLNK